MVLGCCFYSLFDSNIPSTKETASVLNGAHCAHGHMEIRISGLRDHLLP